MWKTQQQDTESLMSSALPARTRRRLFLLVILALVVLLYYVDLRSIGARIRSHLATLPILPAAPPRPPPVPPEIASGFLVNTPGCRIPFLAPLDDSVRRFVFSVPGVDCQSSGPALVEAPLDNNTLLLRLHRDRAHNVSSPESLQCCARALWRPNPDPNRSNSSLISHRSVDDVIVYADNCTYFEQDELVVEDEFVRVECYDNNDTLVYKDFFGFTPDKPPLPSAGAAADVVDPDTPKVSILLVGADSISRSNLLRQMPKTVKILKELGAMDMMGYNKVEDNTFPNLIAVLTGLTVPELRARCWPKSSHPFDACPLIWKRFHALGYRTAYGEEEPWMGIFNYIKRGFVRQPVDYYMRPFARAIIKEAGHTQKASSKLCAGPRLQLKVLLEYATRFSRLPNPLFGLFWGVSLSHDYLNLPQLADPLYEEFLRRARDDGVLNKTIIIFMSDHGIRWGAIRETYQGRLEERLPFLMILLPPWLRESYPSAVANLRVNTRRLTTPFDLHRTLEDLLDVSQLEEPILRGRAKQLRTIKPLPRAISLFLVAPDSRGCQDAGLEPHWCTCHSSRSVANNDSVAVRAAQFVVREVNTLLAKYPECAQLRLYTNKTSNGVLDVRREEGRAEVLGNARKALVRDYTVLLRTTPGNALFEATVRLWGSAVSGAGGRGGAKNTNMTLAGTVSRVNRYGEQSACVSDYHMKLYCFCKGFRFHR